MGKYANNLRKDIEENSKKHIDEMIENIKIKDPFKSNIQAIHPLNSIGNDKIDSLGSNPTKYEDDIKREEELRKKQHNEEITKIITTSITDTKLEILYEINNNVKDIKEILLQILKTLNNNSK